MATAVNAPKFADVKVGEVLAVLEESGTAPATAPEPKAEAPKPDAGAKAADKKATPTAKNVAKAHDVTPAQAILRWHLQLGTYKEEFADGGGWAVERIVMPKSLGGMWLRLKPNDFSGVDISCEPA